MSFTAEEIDETFSKQKVTENSFQILRDNIESLKKIVSTENLLTQLKNMKMKIEGVRYRLEHDINVSDSNNLFNSFDDRILNETKEIVDTLLLELDIVNDKIAVFNVSNASFENSIVLERVEEAFGIFCNLEIFNLKKTNNIEMTNLETFEIVKSTNERLTMSLSLFFKKHMYYVKKIISQFRPSSQGELKLHQDHYLSLSPSFVFLAKIHKMMQCENGNKIIDIIKNIQQNLLNQYLKKTSAIYQTELTRHFESLLDLIHTHRIKHSLNIQMVIESVILIRDGEIEFLKNFIEGFETVADTNKMNELLNFDFNKLAQNESGQEKEFSHKQKILFEIQCSLFLPLMDTLIQFLEDLFNEYKRDILVLLFDDVNRIKQKYFQCNQQENDESSTVKNMRKISEIKKMFVVMILKRVYRLYEKLKNRYFKSVKKRIKDRKKLKLFDILEEEIEKNHDQTIIEYLMNIHVHTILKCLNKQEIKLCILALDRFYKLEKKYKEIYIQNRQNKQIELEYPDDDIEIIDYESFKKKIENVFDKIILTDKKEKVIKMIKETASSNQKTIMNRVQNVQFE